MKLKITSGTLKGRLIQGPKGDQTRPTAEKVRQSFFNSYRSALENSSFLDVFAGSGAMGIEAYSCGAHPVILIESHKFALEAICSNLKSLELENEISVIGKDALLALDTLSRQNISFEFIYLDPPYAMQSLKEKTLRFLDSSPLIKPGTTLFLEEDVHNTTMIEGLSMQRLRYSKTKEIGDILIHVFIYPPT